ncbi:MAG: zinc ribbon domain-containing protein [Coraliomargarita sp.]|nr:zinc ribbon domain-containing protein [Coraliomargarita sp.]
MATYVYETIPENPQEEPEQFEWQQSMMDDPLTHHPETGVPVRRLISGGLGTIGTRRKLDGGNCCTGPTCNCS